MNNTDNQNSPPKPKPESKFSINDKGEFEFGYCTFHGYTDVLFLDDKGDRFHNHYISEDDCVECYGEFVGCEPPPALTDEEWDNIFSMEGML